MILSPRQMWLAAATIALVCLVVGFAVGRGSVERPGRGIELDTTAALAAAKLATERADWQAAHDALLVALRLSPGSEPVFDAGVRFIEAARTGGDNARGLADDLLLKLEGAVPFLPLARVSAARETVSRLAKTPIDEKPQNPFETFDDLCEKAGRKQVPHAVRIRLLQDADTELAAIGRGLALSKDAKWTEFEQRKKKHDDYQKLLLVEQYTTTVVPTLDKWRGEVKRFLERCETDPIAWEARDKEAATIIYEAQKLNQELQTYRTAGVDDARQRVEESWIERDLMQVMRSREWVYNRFTLSHLERLKATYGPLLGMARSLEMVTIDEGRLGPFVGGEFRNAWKKSFDACKPEEQIELVQKQMLRRDKP